MAEYVVKGAEPNETVLHTQTPNGYESWQWLPVREKIVRCRDCKYFSPEHEFEEEVGPNGETERCIEPPSCGNPKRCSMAYDSFVKKYVPVHIYTEPDGFCKWGECKVVDE